MAIKEGYIPVDARIAKFKKEHGIKGSIETEVTINYEKAVAVTKASIKVEDRLIATGHSLTDLEEGEKALEKGEKAAIGRALVNAGYEADSGETESEDSDEKPAKRSSGFGRPKEEAAAQKPSGFGKTAKAQTPVAEEATEESDESEEDSEESEEEAPVAAAPVETKPAAKPVQTEAAKSGGSKIADLMAKYGANKAAPSSSNLRR